MVALTATATLVPVMYEAFAGTATDQAPPVPDVALRVCAPTVTVTLTPLSVPVRPRIAKPAAFSAMFTTLSPAIASRESASVPAGSTVTVVETVRAS